MSPRGRTNPGSGSGPARYPGSFLLAFRAAADRLGWEFLHLHQEMAFCRDPDGREHVVGLENLYRRARRTPREEWPELATEFLRTVGNLEPDEQLPDHLAGVADQLLVRLGLPLHVELDESRVWHAELPGTALVVNLVIDHPDRMCYVTEQLVADSGTPAELWLERARANLLARTPDDCFEVIHEESGLCVCNVADAYDSSRALLLDRLIPEAGAGALVVVPGRDELLVLPVTSRGLPHLHLMKVLAAKNFKNAPYPISDEVYWVREGTWQRFPMEIKGQEVAVHPPPAFLEALKGLAGRPDESPEGGEVAL